MRGGFFFCPHYLEKLRKELKSTEIALSKLEGRNIQLVNIILTQTETIARLTAAERLANEAVQQHDQRLEENGDLIRKLTNQMDEQDRKIQLLSDASKNQEDRISTQNETITTLIPVDQSECGYLDVSERQFTEEKTEDNSVEGKL